MAVKFVKNPRYFYPVLLPECSAEEFIELDNWLWDNIGEEEDAYEYDLWPVSSYVIFRNEEDKFKFILRWS